MKVDELEGFGFPKEGIFILKNAGIKSLFEPQEIVVNKGLLDLKKSFLISVPTASGKTLIAELAMVSAILREKTAGNGRAKCLYIVPLRALASEKYEAFKKWAPLGISVGMSTGDLDSNEPWLASKDIIVATSEKVDSLSRHNTDWLQDIKVVVVDEVHLVHDSRRGPTLEVVIARMRHLNPGLLILALSATVQNAGEIAEWLDAELIESDWRPVELLEGVYYNRSILFNDSRLVDIDAEGRTIKDSATCLAVDAVKSGGQCLVFLNTRRSVESFADGLNLMKEAADDDKQALLALSEKALHVLPEPTKTCVRLAKCIRNGAAFHHAGLLSKQRRIVEEGFKSNSIKIISATPTLAAGVNLPARRVIIKDYQRYDVNLGRVEIPVLEYKQMAGRAGRPGYDEYGEALLIARTDGEKDFLLDNYILAEPEHIYSKLAIESSLRSHVLSAISSNFANSSHGLLDFFSKTLFACQRDIVDLERVLEKVVDFLATEEMIERRGIDDRLITATPFGRRVAQLYIDPLTAVILRESMKCAEEKKTGEISYLHTIARTGELGSLYLRKGDFEVFEEVLHANQKKLLTESADFKAVWDYELMLSEIKMASFLADWINESSEEAIREKYNVAPGDIRSKIEVSVWLLYSMAELGKLTGFSKTPEIQRLQVRVKQGIKEELLDLVSLKGVGRVRARMLHKKGYKTREDLKTADLQLLARIDTIGEKIANSIIEQLK